MLIKIRLKVKEPYYFLVFFLLGFFGHIVLGKALFRTTINEVWLEGLVGAIYFVFAWFYIYLWGKKYENT